MWYDDKCMSTITKNNTIRRCLRKAKDNSDFCGYHQRSKKYHPPLLKTVKQHDINRNYIKDNVNLRALNLEIKKFVNQVIIDDIIQRLKDSVTAKNKLLDQNYDHYLMDMYSSWDEVPLPYQIKLDNKWYHLELVIYHITSQLNHSDMENPYPIYPTDPFTRNSLSCDNILKLKERIKLLRIDINIALNTLLDINPTTLQRCYIESLENDDRFSQLLYSELTRSLRYRLINFRNSQNNFTGYWVPIKEDKSKFENLYDAWKNTPYQIIHPNTYEIMPNFQKQHLYNLLTNSPIEQWGPVDDSTKIKIR